MTPRELVAALKAAGFSYRAIGQVLGVNDSYISQVARGRKSGAHYQSALDRLHGLVVQEGKRDRGELAEQTPRPARRKQRVRGAHYFARGFTAGVGETPAQTGARSLVPLLRTAADAGLHVAWTLAFRPKPPGRGVTPERKCGGKPKHVPRGGAGARPSWTEFETPDVRGLLAQVQGEYGGNLSRALIAFAAAHGWISFPADVNPIGQLIAIDMRAW